jgi:hypothetical protein
VRNLAPNTCLCSGCHLEVIDGEYVVIINDQITPNIIISPRYRKMIAVGL